MYHLIAHCIGYEKLCRFNPIPKILFVMALIHVFDVTSWGYGADHWFSWFVKALSANQEIMAYLAKVRDPSAFLKSGQGRTPQSHLKFTRFVADVGMKYIAISDCYSCRHHYDACRIGNMTQDCLNATTH